MLLIHLYRIHFLTYTCLTILIQPDLMEDEHSGQMIKGRTNLYRRSYDCALPTEPRIASLVANYFCSKF